jgi:hypothetical protein
MTWPGFPAGASPGALIPGEADPAGAGPADDQDSYVTLGTDQAVYGAKTFTEPVGLGPDCDLDPVANPGGVVLNADASGGGGLTVSNNYAPSGFVFLSAFNAFCPNPNGFVQFRVGQSASANNSAEFNFEYVSFGNASNSFAFGLFGNAQIITIDGNGNIALAGGTASTIQIQDGKNISLGTTTGTQVGTSGGSSGDKLAFYGTTPVTQPLLKTGVGHTVDDVITVLQALGLVRQT